MMFRRFATITSAALITSIALVAYAAPKFKKIGGDEKATCDVDVPGFSFTGKVPASALSVSDGGDAITVTVDVSNLDTGIDMRTKDLQKKLKAKKATLVAQKGDLKYPEDGKTINGSANGTLTINGVEKKNHPFTYSATRKGSHVIVSGKTTAKLSEHGMKFCAPGNVVCVTDTMPINVKFKLADE